MANRKIKVGIVGASGYTGVELLRILARHPKVSLEAITSRQFAQKSLASVFPSFEGVLDIHFELLKIPALAKRIQVAFLCLPHHESMNVARKLRQKGIKVIDLSADFRLKDYRTYEAWYGAHTQRALLAEAVYGLPEINRAKIKKTKLIACPGCYPTSIALALAPLLNQKMIQPTDIICDSKSGVSGAGRTLKLGSLYSEVNDSIHAYSIGAHRHTPEIEQTLTDVAGEKVSVLFSPHLIPMDRGILSTVYAKPFRQWGLEKIHQVFVQFYKNEKFVHVLPMGQLPKTKSVRGTNFCQLGIVYDRRSERIVISSAIDNLTKGASGQAVQCFNLMHGIKEDTALIDCGLIP